MFLLANELFKKADYYGASSLYTKLLELDPENKNFNATILANRALCNQKTNRTMDAMKDLNQSLELNPFYAKVFINNIIIKLN